MSTKKTDQPMTEGGLSLPNQSQKSKTHLSEMSLLEVGKLTRLETLAHRAVTVGVAPRAVTCHY
jgi:hypothetical protein